MFLELSFDSQTAGHDAATSATASTRHGQHHQHADSASSLDELISDFHASTTRQHSSLYASSSSSDASELRMLSPPRHSKTKDASRKSWSFANRASVTGESKNQRSTSRAKTKSTADDGELSDSDREAVTPLPRRVQPRKPKPSLGFRVPQRQPPMRSTAVSRAVKPLATPRQPQKSEKRSPVLSSPSLTTPSLSPLTSSPSSVSEDIFEPLTPDEDSIDALIGQDIRELNTLLSTGATRKKQPSGRTNQTSKLTQSRTADEIATALRQSTRFRREEPETRSSRSRPSPGVGSSRFRLKVAKDKAQAARPFMPESPPPPPPPSDDEEDSFAEEIRKLRESRRQIEPCSEPKKKAEVKEEADINTESSEICAAVALKVRNTANAIDNLLLDALKPFEDRQRELEKQEALEKESADGDATIRNAADSALTSAAQTIVSQLNITFADMTERRNAELKADEDADAAAKEVEKKEKEEAEEKKKTEEKEAKQREMEILRLLPMQGKLLTCSADIEAALSHIESAEASAEGSTKAQPPKMQPTVETEIEALRRLTQERIQEIEARMAAPAQAKEVPSQDRTISWRQVDWMQENFIADAPISSGKGDNQTQEVSVPPEIESTGVDDEGAFEQVLKRQVTEKLDLTILQLKHVLSIDSKEAAEALAAQKEEQELQAKQQAEKQQEEERKQRELENAENARRRVMGVTSVDEVSGWVEEERLLRAELGNDRSLQRLMSSLDTRMGLEHWGGEGTNSGDTSYLSSPTLDHDKVLREFDRLANAKEIQRRAEAPRPEIMGYGKDNSDADTSQWSPRRSEKRSQFPGRRQFQREEWLEMSSNFSECDGYDVRSEVNSEEGLAFSPSRYRVYREATRRERRQRSSSPQRLASPCPRRPSPRRAVMEDEKSLRFNADEYNVSRNPRHGIKRATSTRSSSKHKPASYRSSSALQAKVARTIQALQTDRRQKSSWIKSQHSYEHQPVSPYR